MVSLLASLWNRGFGKLRNGLFIATETVHFVCLGRHVHAAATRRRRDYSHQWTDSERAATSRSNYSFFSFLLFCFYFISSFEHSFWWVIYIYRPASSKGCYRLFRIPYFPVRSSCCVTGGNLAWVSNRMEKRREKYLPPPIAINPDSRPLGTYETKVTARTGKRSILAILWKNRGLWRV